MQIPNDVHYHGHSIYLYIFVTYVIISNAVNAMPEPDNTSGKGYKWFFTFAHGVMMQAGRFATKYLSNGNNNVPVNGVISTNGVVNKN